MILLPNKYGSVNQLCHGDRLPINEDTSPPVNEPTWQEIKAWGLGLPQDGWKRQTRDVYEEVHLFPAILGLVDESIMTLARSLATYLENLHGQMDQMACGHHT